MSCGEYRIVCEECGCCAGCCDCEDSFGDFSRDEMGDDPEEDT